jgi:SAM-dependent methyltransferase
MFKFTALKKILSCGNKYNIDQLQTFESILNKNGLSISGFESILDFGCGYGRLTEHLLQFSENAKVSGCEIDKKHVDSCRKRFTDVVFIANDVLPPLNFPDNSFDFIITYSVFTHLSEDAHKKWLEELSNKIKPGGVMMHTIHSRLAMQLMNLSSPEHLTKYNLPDDFNFNSENDVGLYHYHVYDNDMPEYGSTMIDKSYIINNWPNYTGMNILEYSDGALQTYPEGCHDIVLLQKGV